MNIPRTISRGDSPTWIDDATTDTLGNSIQSPDWTLNYAIRGATVLDLVSTPSLGGWSTSMTAVQSAALTAGDYYWQAFATDGSQRITLGNGKMKVQENLATVSGVYDGRTQSRQDLEAVQAAMRTIISGGAVARYSIAGREVWKLTMAELITLESNLKRKVVREEQAEMIANGLGNPRALFVRFK